jgi:hypothetical protein
MCACACVCVCVCVCVYIYIYIYIYTCVYIYSPPAAPPVLPRVCVSAAEHPLVLAELLMPKLMPTLN